MAGGQIKEEKKLTKSEKKYLRKLEVAERTTKNFMKKKRIPEEEKERLEKYSGPKSPGGRRKQLGWKTFYWFEEKGKQLIKNIIDYTKTEPKVESQVIEKNVQYGNRRGKVMFLCRQ